jgi:hypothetical protein
MANTQVKAGDVVRAVTFIGGGTGRTVYGTVLGVNADPALAGDDGAPALSLSFMDPSIPLNAHALGGPRWQEVFQRRSGVLHSSAAAVTEGKESVFWIDVLPAAGAAVSLPEVTFDEEVAAGPVAKGEVFMDDERTGLKVVADGAGAMVIVDQDGNPYPPDTGLLQKRFVTVSEAQGALEAFPAKGIPSPDANTPVGASTPQGLPVDLPAPPVPGVVIEGELPEETEEKPEGTTENPDQQEKEEEKSGEPEPQGV